MRQPNPAPRLKWKFVTNATLFIPANKKLSTRQAELKNSTKNTLKSDPKQTRRVIARSGTTKQSSNDAIANDYDHLTPKDYPIAYTARKWFFCGLPFYVDENVLVPRFETEALVSAAAKFPFEKRRGHLAAVCDDIILG